MNKNQNMVEIPKDKLIAICKEVYHAGLSGCNDLGNSTIEDILVNHGVSVADNWKIFTVEELSKMPVGTVLIHSVWGRCWISARPEEQSTFMSFSNRGPADFRSKSDPWDKCMKIIG